MNDLPFQPTPRPSVRDWVEYANSLRDQLEQAQARERDVTEFITVTVQPRQENGDGYGVTPFHFLYEFGAGTNAEANKDWALTETRRQLTACGLSHWGVDRAETLTSERSTP